MTFCTDVYSYCVGVKRVTPLQDLATRDERPACGFDSPTDSKGEFRLYRLRSTLFLFRVMPLAEFLPFLPEPAQSTAHRHLGFARFPHDDEPVSRDLERSVCVVGQW